MMRRVCAVLGVMLAGLALVNCSDKDTTGGGGSDTTATTATTGNTSGSGGSGNTGNMGGSGGSGNTGNMGGGGAGNTGGGAPGKCGNGVLESGEKCDGSDFGASTCKDLGYPKGSLACSADCSAVDSSHCYTAKTTCGDGVTEGMFEPCDGTASVDCMGAGFSGGTMACTATCQLDASACQGDLCAAMFWYGDGTCNLCELWGGTPDEDCQGCGADGTCVSYLFDGFTIGTSTCLYNTGTEDPDCGACGDGIRDPIEWCDGNDFGPNPRTCADLGYSGGTIGCDAKCHLSDAGCTG